jgi:hypothetical protein
MPAIVVSIREHFSNFHRRSPRLEVPLLSVKLSLVKEAVWRFEEDAPVSPDAQFACDIPLARKLGYVLQI